MTKTVILSVVIASLLANVTLVPARSSQVAVIETADGGVLPGLPPVYGPHSLPGSPERVLPQGG